MNHKILIADDDENTRKIITRIFSDYTVISACDGQEAVALIAAEAPSIVFLDIQMPLMGGLEVLRALRRMEPAPLFIMLTGSVDLEIALSALQLGAASYITKPFDHDMLMQAVVSTFAHMDGRKDSGDKPWRLISPDD